MAGKRLVFLALALLAGGGRDHGPAGATDNPNRDLQRPEVDVGAPLNDKPAQRTASKSSTKTSAKATTKTASKASGTLLASGTAISAKFDAGISSRTHKAGQKLTGTVASDVKDKSGRVVIPKGSKVYLMIAAIHESENKSDKTGKLVLTPTLVSIAGKTYPLKGSATALDRILKDRKTNAGDLAKVGVGAGAGALLGTAVSGGSTKGAGIGGGARGGPGETRGR